MKAEALENLNKLIESKGFSRSEVETNLGMPKNTLSSYLSGSKDMPEKWVEPIMSYLQQFPEFKPKAIDTPRTELVVDEVGLKEKPSGEIMKNLRMTMDKINKDFGAGTVMMLGDKPNVRADVISTGSLTLNEALGVGGLPRGRMVEIYGPESSGKTTLAIHIMVEAQKKGLKCLMVDAEHAFDSDYAANLGLNIDELTICQPSYGEQGLEIADRYIESGSMGVVVIDSVAALIPKAELEGEMGDSKMGLHARLMSQACRKMTASIAKTNTICIFINQLREKIGIAYGNPEVTTGGNALKFYASIRLDVRRLTQIKDGEVAFGNKTKVKVVKNKVAPPFKVAEFDIIYGEGIDSIGEIVDMAVQKNIINKSGSWYSYNTDKLGQGRDAVKSLLKDNEELFEEIKNKLGNQQK